MGSHKVYLSRTCNDKVGVKCFRSHRKIEWMDGDVRIPLLEFAGYFSQCMNVSVFEMCMRLCEAIFYLVYFINTPLLQM